MRSRWLSTFTVIGAVLIVLGTIGLIHHNFVFDPGQVPDGHEPWYYIVVGALMIVNGIFTPPGASDDKQDDEASSKKIGTDSGSSVAEAR
jgi:hypothetical protein